MGAEQPAAKCSEDSGDGRRLQKEPSPTHPHHPERLPSRHGGVLPLPGHRHLPGPQVGAEHQLPHQKSSTEDVLSAAAEEVQPALAIKTALHAGNRNRKAVIVIVFAYNEMLVRRGTAHNTTTTTTH